jgi:hypothetical protein
VDDPLRRKFLLKTGQDRVQELRELLEGAMM